VTTYNLEVANRHNYYADGFLVHNKLNIMPYDKERADKLHETNVAKYGENYQQRGKPYQYPGFLPDRGPEGETWLTKHGPEYTQNPNGSYSPKEPIKGLTQDEIDARSDDRRERARVWNSFISGPTGEGHPEGEYTVPEEFSKLFASVYPDWHEKAGEKTGIEGAARYLRDKKSARRAAEQERRSQSPKMPQDAFDPITENRLDVVGRLTGGGAGGMPAPPAPAGGGAGGSWVPGYGPGGQTPTNPMGGGAPAGGAQGLRAGGFSNLFNRLQANAQSNAFNNYNRSLGNRRTF
jgi:hypothetical protein